MFAACLLSFFIGFLSLSIEILWVRIFSFANFSLPQAFAFVLTLYLVGIAIGSHIGKRYCTESNNLWDLSAMVLFISSLFDLISPWIYVEVISTMANLMIAAWLIVIVAALKAIMFPIAHHLGVKENLLRVGSVMSRVYVFNILGSTLGPIVTGMVLLNYFSTQSCFVIIALLSLCGSFFCWRDKWNVSAISMTMLCGVVIIGFASTKQPHSLIARLAYPAGKLRTIVENRHGIVSVYEDKKSGDIIWGGNVYDGRVNIDPVINSNKINRLLILSVLQKNPEHVLMIGLSIGTWLKLVTTFPNVKSIDVIEINPGYFEAMKQYPMLYSALSDPRVKVYVGDGRRWLASHPDNRYDLLVMNTTFHWRAYAANLLSREFLSIIKNHMDPHAIFAYNATSSMDAFKTATVVFNNAYRYENFIIASDYDWRPNLYGHDAEEILSSLKLDGHLIFNQNNRQLIQHFLHEPVVTLDEAEKNINIKDVAVITDNNILCEYKHGYTLWEEIYGR